MSYDRDNRIVVEHESNCGCGCLSLVLTIILVGWILGCEGPTRIVHRCVSEITQAIEKGKALVQQPLIENDGAK